MLEKHIHLTWIVARADARPFMNHIVFQLRELTQFLTIENVLCVLIMMIPIVHG